ncbi:hypothetical protein KPHES18087_03240 [Corynebacterium ulcerans]|uniref:Uncharacterized protein n=3 Tax=Corynebacterium TaxID=1716 RepID=A0ABD7MU50_CORUL|nr:Hypothetical protein Cul210932_0324 [Corynebacterium ulcerans]AIU31904.1 Hypothetical protein CulFRC11_0307 [Corynebacterium ramonii FRC0011]AKN76221.1 Hypothetical protein CulFRC58_0367 [Corynebacterium ulcerans FRC58]AIU90925.1 Hypothetical protein Cul05146_0333 [Corynebacterium ulcerans]ALD94060.1 Hypothetical protein Cul131001_0329 [Corynebacterium ulcerans]
MQVFYPLSFPLFTEPVLEGWGFDVSPVTSCFYWEVEGICVTYVALEEIK